MWKTVRRYQLKNAAAVHRSHAIVVRYSVHILKFITMFLAPARLIIQSPSCNLHLALVFLQLPSSEEIDALLAEKKMTAVVFFLDETFEELEYDITTTVVEAVEQLAGLIKLQNYSTFTLYESRKVRTHQQSQISPPPCFLEICQALLLTFKLASWQCISH